MNMRTCILIGEARLGGLTTALGVALFSIAVNGQRLDEHPILAKYPSPDDLQRAVDEFKRTHAEEYRTAMVDFTLAVRSNLEVEWPRIGPPPRVIPEWPLRLPALRPFYEMLVELSERKREDGDELWIAFYQEHMDSITVEFTPAVRMVALDVLLNGWDDWPGWDSDRLKGYRERYPDCDRVAAATVLRGYDHHDSQLRYARGDKDAFRRGLDANGFYLRMLVDPELSSELRRAARPSSDDLRGDVDALDYVVKAYLGSDDDGIRNRCLGVAGSLSQTLPKDKHLEFWIPFLNASDVRLRRIATSAMGNSRTRPRDVPPELHPDWEIVQRLRTIETSDPEVSVRVAARLAIERLLDDRPPRGHVKYDKPEQ